jgi:hypothetical protein
MAAASSADRGGVATGRPSLSLLLIALLAPAAAECQSDAALWRFVYPNAKALISIDWQRIRQSPAGAMIREQWLIAGPIAVIPGIELLDEIDRVVISSPGNESIKDTGTGTDVAAAQAPMLVAVGGHFDAVKVRQLFRRLGGKAQAYNSYQVYRPQGQDAKDMAFVLYDAGTILFGDAPSLFAALDRNQFAPPAAEPGSIAARAAELDREYELSLVITTPDIMSNDRLAGLFHGDDWAPDAQGFEAGVNLRSGLAADVTVRFASEAAAKRMVAAMTRLSAIAAKDKAEPQMRDIARKLKFTSDGPAAKISLRLTPQDLEKSARAFASAHQAQVAAEKAVSPAPVAQAPVKPGVIRIEGLDDGPREIPFPDHQN